MALLDKKNIREAFEESRTHMNRYFQPLNEYERLARNLPSPKLAKDLPKVTDGTLAAIIQEQPKRVIQQTPTGTTSCPSFPGLADIADEINKNTLIPMANTMGSVLQKSWNMVGKALTYGVQPSYTFFTETNGIFHTDFNLPYVKDVFMEPGKVYGPDCNILFLRSWYNVRDLKRILAMEKRFMKKDKDYKPKWDIKSLGRLIDLNPVKSKTEQTPAEREKGSTGMGIEIIHGFQAGIGDSFISFAPTDNDNLFMRDKLNKDPRGKMPINFLYANIDLSNPLGRGQVELSGGIQNLIDHQMSLFQYSSTIDVLPPLQIFGSVNKKSIKLRPATHWNMGSQPGNRVEPAKIVSSNAVANFGNNYGLLKSQILNLNSSMDTSVSAEVGNPSFSKTHAGVQTQNQRLSISDNYMRKQFEAWWGDERETSMNMYFAEMEGEDTLDITEELRKKLPSELLDKYTNKKGQLVITYSDIEDVTFKFQVDASSSEVKESSDKVERMTAVLDIANQMPSPVVQEGAVKLLQKITRELKIEGAEELFAPPKDQSGNDIPVQAQQQPQPQPQTLPQQLAPQPQQQDTQAPLGPEEKQFVELLLQNGYSEQSIGQAIVMYRNGVPDAEILQVLEQSKQGVAQ